MIAMPRFRLFLIACVYMAYLPCPASAEALTLVRTEALWRDANIDLKLAKHAISAAGGDVSTADRRENPNLSLSAVALSPRTGIGSGGLRDKNADSVIRLDQLLERGNKRQLRTRSAEARLMAAVQDAAEVQRAGLIQLHSAYWDLKLATVREMLTGSTAQLARDAMTAAEKRLSVGDLSQADTSKLRVDALRSDNDARTTIADRKKAQLALALLIGRSNDVYTLACADDWPSLQESNPATTITAAQIESRSDVRAADQRVAAAESALEGARALAKRDVTVGLQFEHFPSVGEAAPNNTWGLSVSIPLFASHAFEGETLRSRAELDQARDQAVRSRAMASAEAGRASADLQASSERVKRLEATLLPEAEKVATAAEFSYRKGASSLLELLDARRTLRQIQQEAATARNDFAKALSAMRQQAPAQADK